MKEGRGREMEEKGERERKENTRTYTQEVVLTTQCIEDDISVSESV